MAHVVASVRMDGGTLLVVDPLPERWEDAEREVDRRLAAKKVAREAREKRERDSRPMQPAN